MDYYIVDSVKGGCGKTSFSMFLAARLGLEEGTDSKNKRNVCLVDVDMLGTSFEKVILPGGILKGGKTIIDPKSMIKDLKKENLAQIYLNDYILDRDTNKRFVTNLEVSFINDTEKSNFGIILSSPLERDKQKYRSVRSLNSNGIDEIGHSYYEQGLKILIGRLEIQEKKELIFDLPPNVDGYSESVFNILLDKRKRIPEGKVTLFLLTTLDISHINATIEFIDNFLRDSTRKELPDEIFIVINDLFGNYPKEPNDDDDDDDKGKGTSDESVSFQEAIKSIKKDLVERGLSPLISKKIFFIKSLQQREYQKKCIKGGIGKEWDADSILKPFNEFQNFSEGANTKSLLEERICK